MASKSKALEHCGLLGGFGLMLNAKLMWFTWTLSLSVKGSAHRAIFKNSNLMMEFEDVEKSILLHLSMARSEDLLKRVKLSDSE